MGTQQLLLISLGAILVGLAVVVGINLSAVSFADQVKDMAILKVNEIGMQANVYRKKSSKLGGGGESYKGFNTQLSSSLKKDEIVKKIKFKESKNKIKITLVLNTKGDNNRRYRVWAKYKPDGLDRLRVYDPDEKKWVWLFKK